MKNESIAGKIILLVEDHADTREFLSQWLQHRGLTVITASDGVQALNALLVETPDLILTDCRMPNMDGIEFSRQVRMRSIFDHIPIALLSAVLPKNQLKELGIALFLQKPFPLGDLLSEIRRLLLEQPLAA
ncbi:MAG: two component response regulator protein [Herbaspirillum sp.]|jgi:CheY-like chemotaxis protein|nr:two component response regulator protein [Herbaspirillum sp.]